MAAMRVARHVMSISSTTVHGALVAMALLGGCAHLRPVGTGFNVSSERSDYSPAVRLAVALPFAVADTAGDSLTIVIDSAVVTAPGAPSPDTTPVMRNLYIDALLATRGQNGGETGQLPTPWVALATSDSVPLLGALHLGVPTRAGPLRLRVLRPRALDATRTWLVFRITGTAISNVVRLANGDIIPTTGRPRGVRVFACADWNLAGYVDRARAKSLARAYNAAC
jgi:hypothetical protein